MDDMPPRRSRRPQKKRSAESTFPLIPFLIGVIVLGFVIGAGLSMAGRGGSSGQPVAVLPSALPAPSPSPTFAPATLAPLATPRPIPSMTAASETPSQSPHSPVATSPSPHATPSHAAPHVSAAIETAKPSPNATRVASTLIPSPVTPAPPHSHAVPVKSAAPTAAASTQASTTSAPETTVDAESDFGRLSASVVRQYLRALGRGDTDSAYGAFGVSPGASGVAFPEQSAMQAPGQIVDIQSRGNNDTQYVTVDIATPDAKYYATYGVHRTPTGAAVIVTHSIVKQ